MRRRIEHRPYPLFGALDEIIRLRRIDKAAGQDFRLAHDFARRAIDSNDGDEESISREMLAVAQHRRPDVADAQAVHQDMTAVDALGQRQPVGPHFNHLSALHDQHILPRDAGRFGGAGMQHQMPVLAVHGDEEPGCTSDNISR